MLPTNASLSEVSSDSEEMLPHILFLYGMCSDKTEDEIMFNRNGGDHYLGCISCDLKRALNLLSVELIKIAVDNRLIKEKDDCGHSLVHVVSKILKAVRKKTVASLSHCTMADYNNLVYAAHCAKKTSSVVHSYLFKFWAKYLDCITGVCMWIGAKSTATKIQTLKRNMFLVYGPPPFTSEASSIYLHSEQWPKPRWMTTRIPGIELRNSSFSKQKTDINLVVIGNVDSGKSTTAGQLIYKCGGIEKRNIEELEQKAYEMATFKYAWLYDKKRAESSEHNINVDTALWKFETRKFYVTMVDGMADCALLIISAEESESDFVARKEKTLQQLHGAYEMGIKQLIVGVNKMDLTEPPYSETRYEEIKKEVSSCINEVGYDTAAVPFVPISAWNGVNVLKASTEDLTWYNGWCIKPKDAIIKGESLLEALDAINSRALHGQEPSSVLGDDNFSIR